MSGEVVNAHWDESFCQQTKCKAGLLLTLLRKPSVIVSLVSLDKFLGLLKEPTINLQKRELDILAAYEMMNYILKVI